jgi:hypothetical protein
LNIVPRPWECLFFKTYLRALLNRPLFGKDISVLHTVGALTKKVTLSPVVWDALQVSKHGLLLLGRGNQYLKLRIFPFRYPVMYRDILLDIRCRPYRIRNGRCRPKPWMVALQNIVLDKLGQREKIGKLTVWGPTGREPRKSYMIPFENASSRNEEDIWEIFMEQGMSPKSLVTNCKRKKFYTFLISLDGLEELILCDPSQQQLASRNRPFDFRLPALWKHFSTLKRLFMPTAMSGFPDLRLIGGRAGECQMLEELGCSLNDNCLVSFFALAGKIYTEILTHHPFLYKPCYTDTILV